MDKIQFKTNVPIEVALAFRDGKEYPSKFENSPPQFMFTTTDERVFFVDQRVATKIKALNLAPREPFEIVKAEIDGGNGRKWIDWQVAKVGFAPGEQPDGTFAVEVEAAAPARLKKPGTGVVRTPAPVATAATQPPATNNNGHGTPSGPAASPEHNLHQGWAQFLLSQTNALVDVYAAALRYASEAHGNAVKAEDVRSLMLSAFINQSKNGGANVA